MGFSGKSLEFSVADSLELVHKMQKTGVLKVSYLSIHSGKKTETSLFFKSGYAVGIECSDTENLYKAILDTGYINKKELDEAIKLQLSTYPNHSLEDVLILTNKVEKSILVKVLYKYIEDETYSVISQPCEKVRFVPNIQKSGITLKRGINVEELLINLSQKKDETARLESLLPPKHYAVSLTSQAKRSLKTLSLPLDEWRVLLAIDGEKTIAELENASIFFDKALLLSSLYNFLNQGLISITPPSADNKKTTLLVDDSRLILQIIQLAFAKSPYKLITAETGSLAYKKLQDGSYKPNLIILDVFLGDMNGYDLCSNIRQIPGYETTPIIFLSANQSEAEKKKGIEAGATAYLTKPFKDEELLEMVDELIGGTGEKGQSE